MWGRKIIERAETAAAAVNTEIATLSVALIVAAGLLLVGMLALASAVARA